MNERSEISRRIRRVSGDDSGISIIEVLAATLIFMLLFVGIAQGLVTVIRLSGDQRHRVTALSLAASEIDKVRAYQSVFDIKDDSTEITPDEDEGTTYTVTREIAWVDSAGNDVSCGGSSGTSLQMLRVNIEVTWNGQVTPISPVKTDTIIAPNGSLNDPNTSVLILAVKGADGFGVEGVTVGLTASGTVSGTVPVPSVTDDNGCSYALGVPPGDYKIKLSKDGTYVDLNGNLEPITMDGDDTVAHTYKLNAGTTRSLTAFMAKGALYNLRWDTGDPALNSDLNSASPARPWTWVGSRKVTLLPLSSTTTRTKAFTSNPLRLYPDPVGYSAVYGDYSTPNQAGQYGCLSPNPAKWPAGSGLKEGVVDAVPGDSSSATSMRIGVGVVRVKLTSTQTQISSSSNSTAVPTPKVAVTATMQGTGGNQNPGCVMTMALSTSQLAANNNEFDLLLPYGAWTLSLTTPDSTVWRTGTSSSNYKRYQWNYAATFTQVTRGSLSGGTNLVLDPRQP